MDFFNSAQRSQNPTGFAPGIDGFAKAIQDRFGPQSTPFTPLPMLATPSPRPAPMASSASASPSSFEAITPAMLPSFLARSKTLVLDIRPHNAFCTARVTSAISFSVPSTLLKRPLFSTQRLGTMLSSSSARAKFAAWADQHNILVYDADSTSIPPTSNINGLLQKFKNEGYSGNLAFISGGFQAVWRERRDLTTSGPPSVEEEEEEDNAAPAIPTTGTRPQAVERPTLRTKHLPISAFSIASTTASHTSSSNNPSNYHPGASHVDPGKAIPSASNPFFDAIRQNVELSQGVTERIPLRLPSRIRRRIRDIPFPWLQTIARHAAPDPDSPPMVSDSSASETDGEFEDQMPEVSKAEQDEATEALALQFYRIELAEQRRLQAVMDFHSNESRDMKDTGTTDFPYSITAGIEKGAKNRYRHIWPFEHARVRLQPSSSPSSDKDDYVNASHIQPLGTNKRYIATQGPLDATFADFWTLVWQQNVHVIVMLTREVEGSLVKCGRYWKDGQYGHLVLNLVSESGDLDHQMEKDVSGGASAFFSEFRAERQQERRELPAYNKTIKRVFRLRHTKYPKAGERRIIQLQYLGWPDMTVPDDPRGVVQLIRETDAAVRETDSDLSPPAYSGEELDPHTGIWFKAKSHRPVLLHCSAGVGRTGGFIAVDAILDALRREIRQIRPLDGANTAETHQEGEPMDVDPQTSLQSSNGSPNISNKRGDAMSPTPLEMKTRQWAERVSESIQNEAPLNPNRHTPALHAGVNSPRLSDVNRSSRSSEERSSAEFSRFASGSSSMTSFSPLSQVFPSIPSAKPGLEAGLHNGPQEAKVSSTSNVLTHDRSRAFSTPTSGASGFFGGPLKHRASVSSVLPGPHHLSPPGSLSSSPAPIPQSTSGSGSSSSVGSLGQAGPTMPLMPAIGSLAVPALTQTAAENSSSNPSVTSSRSPSPPTRHNAGATSSSSSNPSLPLRMKMLAPLAPQPVQQLSALSETSHTGIKQMLPTTLSSNYTRPRPLHEKSVNKPISLSSYDDPILTVLQDMREQRMSLCQSLRQYVFVHAAVIEGAIQIVDEERRAWAASKGAQVVPMDTTPMLRPDMLERGSSSTAATAGTVSTGKRGASPTELPIEDKQGGVRLAKRLSVKKKTGSDESYYMESSPSIQTPKPGHVNILTTLSSSREDSPSLDM